MTRRMLRRQVLLVIAYLLAVLALAVAAKALGGRSPLARFTAETIASFSSLFVAIPAAWLAYCFSRRSAFLSTLDALWRRMVEAKGLCVEFTRDGREETYRAALSALSRVIDDMRSVYRNVDEAEDRLGLFPYEPLHDINRAMKRAGAEILAMPAEGRAQPQSDLRDEIVDLWRGLSHRFLREFGAPAPDHPILERHYRDPRRADD